MSKGWIKVERDITDLPLWTHEKKFDDRSAFIDLLLMANYADRKFKPRKTRLTITVHAGEIFTSMEKLARRWGWSEGKVDRYLDMLVDDNIVRVKRTTYGTIITLVKYGRSGNSRTDNEGDDSADDDANDEGDYEGDYRGDNEVRKKKNKEVYKKNIEEQKKPASQVVSPWGGSYE